jgi:hypothetical protein
MTQIYSSILIHCRTDIHSINSGENNKSFQQGKFQEHRDGYF